MGEMDEVLKEFIVESAENLDQLDRSLLALEKDPASTNAIEVAFRAVHTVKGNSAMFGFAKLQALAHSGEDLFSRLRDKKLRMNRKIATVLLAMVDTMRRVLGAIEKSGSETSEDHAALIAQIGAAAASKEGSGPAPAPPAETAPAHLMEVAETADGRSAAIQDSTIRVPVGLLDKLMTLVGELVLSRNNIIQYTAMQGDVAFAATSQRLDMITADLQEGVMKTRMQPIGSLWAKFPRMVRDLSVACGKNVRIEMEGASTELDRTIIEAIKDPLTHLVRNAVDHGIEAPPKRKAAGKPEEGRFLLRAYHEGGQVIMEVSDDGGGIDVKRVREKALQLGLITAETVSQMSEREILNLIFHPGFSTAEQVTSISGRGVGMDVVGTNIKKIGGAIDIETKQGAGTTFRIRIPLTLAIIPGLLVRCRSQRYAIAQVNLVELVRLKSENGAHHIELIQGCPVYRLRGHLLPLIHLSRELHCADADKSDAELIIVVLKADERQFGLVVDGILDMQEIVVKPLGRLLKGIELYAGATIMGDGKVALILDAAGLAQRAHVISKAHAQGLAEEFSEGPGDSGRVVGALESRKGWMIVEPFDGTSAAIPVSDVVRLEVFSRTLVEKAAGRRVIQYRGHILPLLDLPGLVYPGAPSAVEAEQLRVVVIKPAQDRPTFGLVVGRIMEGVEAAAVVEGDANRAGIVGSALLVGKVTDILDISAISRLGGLAASAQKEPA